MTMASSIFSESAISDYGSDDKVTVAVIGACGFLGQHLLKELHTRSYPDIGAVRVLDFMPFKPNLDYSTQASLIDVYSVVGSVMCMDDVLTVTKGATTVFHLASITDNRLFPDHPLERTVNVQGTLNVINACIENRVENLIYASSVSAVMGYRDISRGTESTVSYPRKHLFRSGRYKSQAEQFVLKANGKKMKDDSSFKGGTGKLKTVALRLVPMYGELESLYFPRLVSLASDNQGHLPCVGSLKTGWTIMYVGNAACALLCAHEALNKHVAMPSVAEVTWKKASSSVVEGKAYFVCDDTPPFNLLMFMRPLLCRYGFFLTSWTLPERWAKLVIWVVYMLLWLLYPILPYNPPVSSSDVHALCHTFTFSDNLARAVLSYRPMYSLRDALRRTRNFYDTLYKDSFANYLYNECSSKHVGLAKKMAMFVSNVKSLNLGDRGKRFRYKLKTGTLPLQPPPDYNYLDRLNLW